MGGLDAVDGVDEDVRRLDVAVDEAGRVGGVEGGGDTGEQGGGAIGVEAVPGGEAGGEVAAADQPHRDEHPALGLPGLEDGDDVGVVEVARDRRLAEDALPGRLVPATVEDLQRDGAAAGVDSAMDGAHRGAADELDEPVAGVSLPVIGDAHVPPTWSMRARWPDGTTLVRVREAPNGETDRRFLHGPCQLRCTPHPSEERRSGRSLMHMVVVS